MNERMSVLQVGRSSESQIDCVVMDTVPGAKTFDDLNVSQSTISRYSCRIVVSRHAPYTARIYAAGFDTSKNIFLGVGSSKLDRSRHASLPSFAGEIN